MGACCCTTEGLEASPEIIVDAVKAEKTRGLVFDESFNLESLGIPSMSDTLYDCVLERELGVPWGMELDPMHPYLSVASVQAEGAVERCNSKNAVQIRKDDIIIRVNGVEGAPKQMIRFITDEHTNKLELQCARPRKLEVEMERQPGQAWGFDVQYQTKFNGLFVKGTTEASIAQAALSATDLILSVNDIAGNPVHMKEAIKATDKLKMHILRIDGMAD